MLQCALARVLALEGRHSGRSLQVLSLVPLALLLVACHVCHRQGEYLSSPALSAWCMQAAAIGASRAGARLHDHAGPPGRCQAWREQLLESVQEAKRQAVMVNGQPYVPYQAVGCAALVHRHLPSAAPCPAEVISRNWL